MAQFPALPFWTDAYLGDTSHLTTIEHGAYLLLLFTAWRSKDCSLPDDDKLLARYARLSPAQWTRCAPQSSLSSMSNAKGIWRQGRLTDEYEAVKRKRDSNIRAGTVSALKRHERRSTDVPTSVQQLSDKPITLNLNPPPISPADFPALWENWQTFEMGKGNRQPALKAYEKAINSGADPAAILLAAQAYCAG